MYLTCMHMLPFCQKFFIRSLVIKSIFNAITFQRNFFSFSREKKKNQIDILNAIEFIRYKAHTLKNENETKTKRTQHALN